jgi:hypothetical protein
VHRKERVEHADLRARHPAVRSPHRCPRVGERYALPKAPLPSRRARLLRGRASLPVRRDAVRIPRAPRGRGSDALRAPSASSLLFEQGHLFVGVPEAIGAMRCKHLPMLHECRALSRELVGHPSAERERRYALVKVLCPLVATSRPCLAMRCPCPAMRCPCLAMRCPCPAMPCPCPAMSRPCLAMRCPCSAMLCLFCAMLSAFPVMLRASFGHPHPERATRSLVLTTPRQSRGRAVPFVAHRDVLAAIPSGPREAHRVVLDPLDR